MRAEHFGQIGAELVPTAVDHRLPALVLVEAHLFHGDVVVGVVVVLDEVVDHLDLDTAARSDRRGGGDRALERAADERVDRLEREPRGQTVRLLGAPSGERGIGADARSGRDALGFAVPHPQELHQCTSNPRTRASSASATSGSITLIVVMPIARAGLRLIPRSSRYTASGASTPSLLNTSS